MPEKWIEWTPFVLALGQNVKWNMSRIFEAILTGALIIGALTMQLKHFEKTLEEVKSCSQANTALITKHLIEHPIPAHNLRDGYIERGD